MKPVFSILDSLFYPRCNPRSSLLSSMLSSILSSILDISLIFLKYSWCIILDLIPISRISPPAPLILDFIIGSRMGIQRYVSDIENGRAVDEVKDRKPAILESLTFIRQQDSLKVAINFIQIFPILCPNHPITILKSAILKTFILETANFYPKTSTYILENAGNYPRGVQLVLP